MSDSEKHAREEAEASPGETADQAASTKSSESVAKAEPARDAAGRTTRKKRPRPPTTEEVLAERAVTRRQGIKVFGVLCVIMPALFFINLLREKHRHDEEMGLTSAAAAAMETGERRVLDNEEELTILPKTAVKPSHHDVAFAIGSILSDARECLGNGGPIDATWVFTPDGYASDMRPTDGEESPENDAAERKKAFACVAATVKRAHVSPFAGEPIRVVYTFRRAVK